MSGNMADWYMEHQNMVTLMDYMAVQAEYDKGDMAYATEKPWKFEAVFREAERTLDASAPKDARDKMMLNAQYGKRRAAHEDHAHKMTGRVDIHDHSKCVPGEVCRAGWPING